MSVSLSLLAAVLLSGGCAEGITDGVGQVTALDAGAAGDGGTTSTEDGGGADGGEGAPIDGGTEGDGSTPGGDGGTPAEACLSSPLLEHFGASRFLVGGDFDDTVAPTAPFDIRYHYLAGGISAGDEVCTSCESACAAEPGKTWWGCWQDPTKPPGQYLTRFLSKAADLRHIPLVTYYQQLDASGAAEGTPQVTAMADASLMSRYLKDFRFMLQTIGSARALVHVEPDLWGYLQRVNADPRQIPVAVSTANPDDCADLPNDATGFGRCLTRMARTYAPNVRIGLHASGWATGVDALYNRDGSHDVTADAREVARFLGAVAPDADFVGVDPSDRDAGYYASIGKQKWWDRSDATLPHYGQAFAWTTALTTALGKPALWWQLPLGNMALEDAPNRWKDNRVDTLFARAGELSATNTFAMVFGAGRSDQTLPSTDDGNFSSRVRDYVDSGGAPACR